MNKKDLKKLALLGIFSGIAITQPAQAEEYQSEFDQEGNRGYHLFTEDELMLELNAKHARIYMSLSPEGKELARKVASQRCQNTNYCKGLNACKTDKNECAGRGDCKGTSKCGFADKNLAVKVVANKMADKRKSLTN